MIRKHVILEDLHDRNETLYHRILVDHMEEMAPIIYTPTVGQACNEFALRFRRPRGMYFSADDRGHMAASKFFHWFVLWDGSLLYNHSRSSELIPLFINQSLSGLQLAPTKCTCHCGHRW